MTKNDFQTLSDALPLLDPYRMRIAILHLYRRYMDMHHPEEKISPLQCTVSMEYGVNVTFHSDRPNLHLPAVIRDVPFLRTLHVSSSHYFFSLSADPKQILAMRQRAQSDNITIDDSILFPRLASIEASYAELLQQIDRCEKIPALLQAYQSRAYIDYLFQRDFGWDNPLEWSSEQHAVAQKMHTSVQWLNAETVLLHPSYTSSQASQSNISKLSLEEKGAIPHAFAKDICTWVQGIGRNAKEYAGRQNYNVVECHHLRIPVSRALQLEIDRWHTMFEGTRRQAMMEHLFAESPRVEQSLEIGDL